MANLRDVLSHFASFLDQSTPADKVASQLFSAEEHLRRAILEPYEIALGDLTPKFESTYKEYKARVLPSRLLSSDLQSAPNQISIEASLGEIDRLALAAKHAKARNVWDEQWDEGVAGLPDAYEKLFALRETLQSYISKVSQSRMNAWSIGIGVAGIVIGVAISTLFFYLSQPQMLPAAPAAIDATAPQQPAGR